MTATRPITLRDNRKNDCASAGSIWYCRLGSQGTASMTMQLTGGCRCGTVRYRIVGEPVLVCGCCCEDCARITGNPVTVWVGIHAPMIEFLEELPVVRETAPISERGHCADCGTPLTFRRIHDEAERDPLFYVTADSLDDPNQVKPSEIIYYDQRPAGFEAEPGIPRHPGPSPAYGSRKRHGKLH